MPQECVDPVVTGAELISALQTVVSRSLAPSDAAVLSVCRVRAGEAYNVIPNTFEVTGSVPVSYTHLAQGGKQHAQQEEEGGAQVGQARAAAGLHAGGGLGKAADGGDAEQRARDGGRSVHQEHLAEGGEVAVLIQQVGLVAVSYTHLGKKWNRTLVTFTPYSN